MVSWDHIFDSLNQYFTSLRQELASTEGQGHMLGSSRGHQIRDITQQELNGLMAVCKLITAVANNVR